MFKKILNHKFVSFFSISSLLFSVGGFLWAWFALYTAAGASPLILHFNDIRGITSVGGFGELVFVGILGVCITVANGFIAFALDERDAILGKLVSVLTLTLSILLFIGFASIISVN